MVLGALAMDAVRSLEKRVDELTGRVAELEDRLGLSGSEDVACMFCGRPAKEGAYFDGPQGAPLEPVCEVCKEKAENW
jgi:hypothetical protein